MLRVMAQLRAPWGAVCVTVSVSFQLSASSLPTTSSVG